MKMAFFWAGVTWLVVALFHARHFTHPRPGHTRHPGTLLVAAYALGWAAYCAREGHLLPLAWAHIPTTAALVLGPAGAGLCTLIWTVEALAWWDKRKWGRR